jgi:hypothetical protein
MTPSSLTELQREVLADVLRHTARTGDPAFRDTDIYPADSGKRRTLAYLCRLGLLERVSPHGEDVFLSRKGITAVRLAGLLDRDEERVLVSCSWCSHLNDVTASRKDGTPTFCGACRHRADLPRIDCDCAACSNPQQPQRLTEADVEEALRQLGVE